MFVFLALLEERAEHEIAGKRIYVNHRKRKCFDLEREANEYRYQTAEGEENVESTNEDEVEHSGALIEVIETSNVS